MEKNKVEFRLGSDPEVFLQNSSGKLISAIGYIKADKWNPLQIPGMAPGYTLQEDNVSLEYGIPPAATPDEFVHHLRAVMEKSKEWLPGLSFSKLSCAVFPDDQLKHPLAKVFGCEPDYNAWTGETNPKPCASNPNLRSAGGHIHVETQENPWLVVQAMDVYLGVPSVLMDPGEDRKQLYGKGGACRIKSYGPEYRTLSNFWIFDDELIRRVWRNTERAILGAKTLPLDSLAGVIQEAINTNNKDLAKQLVDEFDLEVV